MKNAYTLRLQESDETDTREAIISQLRYALYLAESPKNKLIEFDICDTTFCIEFND